MTERILPGIGLTGYWDQGAPWKVGGDQNWLRSSVLTQLAVESATTSLPASPLNGVIYIVPVGDANANQVAARDNGAWVYMPPQEGWTAYVRDTDVLMNFDGAAWTPSTSPLAAPDGAAQIGTAGGGSVELALAQRVKVIADYAAMLAYPGVELVQVTDDDTAGLFRYDASLPNVTNGITRFAHVSGTGARERIFGDTLLLEWAGVKFDGTDETAKVQAACDAILPGQVLTQKTGESASVSLIEFYQNKTRYVKLRLKTINNAPGFSTPFTLTSFGTYPDHNGSDLVFEDCYVDGNRVGQTTVPAVGEDGGLHGFRLERGVRNIKLLRNTSEYCATDGLIFFNSARTPRFPLVGAPADIAFVENVYVESHSSNWNRRHGGSGFSMKDVTFEGTYSFNNNGADLPGHGADPWTAGAKGARLSSGAEPYPNGFDLEQESQATDRFTYENIRFAPGGEFLNNARRGILIYTRGVRGTAGYKVAKNISVKGCQIGVGFATNVQTETAFSMEQNTAPFAGQIADLLGLEVTDNTFVVPLAYSASTPISVDCVDGPIIKRNTIQYADGTSVSRATQFTPPQGRSNTGADLAGNNWTYRASLSGQFSFSTGTKSYQSGDVIYYATGITSASTVDTRVSVNSGLVEIFVRQADGNLYRMSMRLASAANLNVVDAGGAGNSQVQKYLAITGAENTFYTVLRYSIASGTLRLEHVGAAFSGYAGNLDIRIVQLGTRFE